MRTRAATLSGSFMKVTLGLTSKVLGAGKYSYSGYTRATVDASEFGVDCAIFEFGGVDAGTISLADISFDPTDPQQNTLQNCVKNCVKLTGDSASGLLFWINSTSYLAVGANGNILMTQGGKMDSDRNGMAKTAAEGKVSGDFFELQTY
jgi:hypothetical protein